VELILTSPLVRARQTAELLGEVLSAKRQVVPVRETPSLAPPGHYEAFLSELQEFAKKGAVVAVGHEPILGHFIGKACFPGEGRCPLKKGGMAAIEFVDGGGARGTLLWLLQPRQLRAMR
jgi:phosphohistidine phosphatase